MIDILAFLFIIWLWMAPPIKLVCSHEGNKTECRIMEIHTP